MIFNQKRLFFLHTRVIFIPNVRFLSPRSQTPRKRQFSSGSRTMLCMRPRPRLTWRGAPVSCSSPRYATPCHAMPRHATPRTRPRARPGGRAQGVSGLRPLPVGTPNFRGLQRGRVSSYHISYGHADFTHTRMPFLCSCPRRTMASTRPP